MDRQVRLAMIDNYDSFTYNLVQYMAELGAEPVVFRNDEVTVDELAKFDGIVISPGPGTPDDAGVSNDAVRALSGKTRGRRALRRVLRDRDAIMQPSCRQYHREIGSLRLGKLLCVGDDSPHMSLVMRRVARVLLLGDEGSKPGFPLRWLLDHR